jgi:conjugal transfer/entry exclusion protein
MKRLTLLAIGLPLAFGGVAPAFPAMAQLKVYDGQNHVENILSALRAFIQIQNQLTMLTKQQGGIDRFAAQMLIGQSIQVIGQLANLTNALGDRPLYDGVYGPLPPGQTGIAISDSWNEPRSIGHATSWNTYAVLRDQLLQSQRQMEQVQVNLANSNTQVGVVGSIQAATEMLGTLGDQLNTVQLVNAQQLRLMNAQEAQRLQKQERGLAAYEIQSAPLQITLPPSRLRSLFE